MKKILNNTIIKYLISGSTSAFVDLFILHLLDTYTGFHYLVSVNIAFLCAFFLSFYLQKHWTFSDKNQEKTKVQMIMYLTISAINVFVNSFLIHTILNNFSIPEIFILKPVVTAQIIAAFFVATESFFVYRYFIFKKSHNFKLNSSEKNILIITQKIDKNDSYFGFFHDWVKKFAENCNKVTIISLETYEYSFPDNVKVFLLGKEHQKSKINYLKNLYKYIYEYRNDYDVVFCHMSPLYVIAGYPVWKILNKRIVLWYVHRSVDLKLKIANILVDKVLTATKESYRINSNKVHYLGQAINIEHFSNRTGERKSDGFFNIITVGRITPIKRLDVLIDAISILDKQSVPVKLFIAGAPVLNSDLEYESSLQKKIKELNLDEKIIFLGPVPYIDIPKHYWNSDICVNLAPTGGLDKTGLEAMMAGIPLITSNKAFEGHFGQFSKELIVNDNDPEDTAYKIFNIYNSKKYVFIGFSLRKEVIKRSSLDNLIANIVKELYI